MGEDPGTQAVPELSRLIGSAKLMDERIGIVIEGFDAGGALAAAWAEELGVAVDSGCARTSLIPQIGQSPG